MASLVEQAKSHICSLISQGRMQRGDRLPSYRELGGQLGMASSHHAEAIVRPTLVIAYDGEDPKPQYQGGPAPGMSAPACP